MFENVDGQLTDDRVIGILIAHLRAFGSSELKSEGDIVITSVHPLCYLLLNRWTKFNQILCVSYSHEFGVQLQFFLAPPPGALGRGQKVKYHLITKSNSKIFIPNFVFVVT